MANVLVIDDLSGRCPVQATGTLDGHAFYFRARGASWTFQVAEIGARRDDDLTPAVDAGRDGSGGWVARAAYGTWPDAGHMPETDAHTCILIAAAAWRAHVARGGLRGLFPLPEDSALPWPAPEAAS